MKNLQIKTTIFLKTIFARILDTFGVLSHILRKKGNDYVRVVNYHSIPAEDMPNFKNQLKEIEKYYAFITPEDLYQYIGGEFSLTGKPGILLTFDDGFKDNYYISKLLDELGIKALFFVCSGKMSTDGYLTKEDILDMKGNGHSFGNHTASHHRFSENDGIETINYEVVGSNADLYKLLGIKINSFCWVGGELDVYQKKVFDVVKKNYQYVFTTCTQVSKRNTNPLMIHRTNIDSFWDVKLVKFQISGLWDLFYKRKTATIEKRFKEKSYIQQ